MTLLRSNSSYKYRFGVTLRQVPRSGALSGWSGAAGPTLTLLLDSVCTAVDSLLADLEPGCYKT